jgi:hypothetical protein
MNVELPDTTPDNDRLASLLFELASQLHAERARRLALECALEEAGSLPADWVENGQAGNRYQQLCQEALDDSMDRLMRIMAESSDPRTPLRHEAAGFEER